MQPSAGGSRAYIAIAGGIDVPDYLGSKSTFPGGAMGGHQGRALRVGDMLPLGLAGEKPSFSCPAPCSLQARPGICTARLAACYAVHCPFPLDPLQS